MTRPPTDLDTMLDQHRTAKVPPLLRKPDGTTVEMPAPRTDEQGEASPRTTSQILQAILDAAAEATEVGELGYSKATAEEVMARQVPSPASPIDLRDPLGLNPKPHAEPADHACDAPDCCTAADQGVDGMVQRVRRTVPPVSMAVAEREAAQASADAIAAVVAVPYETTRLPEAKPASPDHAWTPGVVHAGAHRPRPSGWVRAWHAVKPWRSKAARGVTKRQKVSAA